VQSWIMPLFFTFAGCYVIVTLFTWWHAPHTTASLNRYPWLWVVPVLNALAVLNIPRAMHLRRPGYAFFSSAMVILALAALFSVAVFPNLVRSTVDAAYSITLRNARSSEATLRTMLLIAAIGMPCVLSYTCVVYWVFRGKVQLDSSSY